MTSSTYPELAGESTTQPERSAPTSPPNAGTTAIRLVA